MKHAAKIATTLLILALLEGCSTWNPFSSDKVKPAPLVQFSPDLTVAKSWSVDVGKSESGVFSPVAYNGMVYAASAEGWFFAVDKNTGAVRWKVKGDSKLKAGVAVTVDTVAAVDVNNNVVAFDFNGKQKWKVALGTEVHSMPVGASGVLFLRSIDYSVMALSADNGLPRWKYTRPLPPLTLRTNSSVDVKNGRVFAGFPGGRLVGLDLNNGQLVWEGVLSAPKGTTEIERIADITGSPIYNFREVCAAAFQGKVGCLDTSNGRALWSTDFSSPNGASVDDRYLIASDESGDLFAFSRSGGKQVWRISNFEQRQPTAPLVQGRAVVIGDFEGYVHFIDRDTGKTIARTQIGAYPFTHQPQAADGNQVLLQSRKGQMALITIQ